MDKLLAGYVALGSVVLPLAGCLLIGYFWRRFNRFEPAFVTFLVTRISTPCLVFHTLATTPLDDRLLGQVALLALSSLALCAVLAWPLLATRNPAALMAAVFPNTGNFGLPVAYLGFGQAGFSVAVLFFASCAIVQHCLGSSVSGKGLRIGTFLRQPSLIAVAAALLSRQLPELPPDAVLQTTRLLGGITMPLMLLMLGNALAQMPREGLCGGMRIGVVRLVAGPVAGLAAGWLLGVPREVAVIGIVQMAMPVAVISYVYAGGGESRDADSVAGAVLLSTLAAVLLLPPLLWVVQGGA